MLGLSSFFIGGFGAYYAIDFQQQILSSDAQIYVYFQYIHFVLMLVFLPLIILLEYQAQAHQKFLNSRQRELVIGVAVFLLIVPGMTAQFLYDDVLKKKGYEFCNVIGVERRFNLGKKKRYHINLYKKNGQCVDGVDKFTAIQSGFLNHFNHQRHIEKRQYFKELRNASVDQWREIYTN